MKVLIWRTEADSEREAEFRYKKEVYELAKQRAKDVDNVMEYRMPEAYDSANRVTQDKRFAVPLDPYRDFDGEEKANNFAEQKAWETHQIGKARLKFGAPDKKGEDDYEQVFEDQIEFIQASTMAGG